MSDQSPVLPAHVEVISPQSVLPFEGAHWYDLADAEHVWMRWRMAEAVRVLHDAGVDTNRRLRALDVGGGTGVARSQLEAVSGWSIDLAELDTDALAQSAPGRGRTLHYDNLQRRPELEASYDVVMLFDVLEHIEDTAPFIDALLWHLRPGGHLLVNVPALPAAHSRYDDAAGHVRRYTRQTLRAELAGAPLDVLTLRYWGAGLLPALFARKAYLGTVARRAGRDEVLQRGFKAPGPKASGLLDVMVAVERLTLRRPPLGSSLLLLARRR